MRAVVAVLTTLLSCVEYPRTTCDTYDLSIGVDAPDTAACDVVVTGEPGGTIHADPVLTEPTLGQPATACSIPDGAPAPVACSSDSITALSCDRTCTTLWITSTDPTLAARLGNAEVDVTVTCAGQPAQTFTRGILFADCPL
jgi:hypothetical protein